MRHSPHLLVGGWGSGATGTRNRAFTVAVSTEPAWMAGAVSTEPAWAAVYEKTTAVGQLRVPITGYHPGGFRSWPT